MIKARLKITMVLAALIAGSLAPYTAEAGIKEIFAEKEPLPAIELKDMEFKGTAASGFFEPIAIVENTLTKESFWYKEGDTLGGGRIVEIRRGALVLEISGRKHLFGMPEGSLGGAGTTELVNRREETLDIEPGKKVGDNEWNVSLDTAINILTKAGKIIKEVRVRPYFAIGRAAGVRVDRIKEASLVKKMGIKDGDIIKGVNGFGLATPTKIFEAYRKYKRSDLIELQVLRENEPTTLTYNIVR